MEQLIRDEAIRLGDSYIKGFVRTASGGYWESPKLGLDGTTCWSPNPSIYEGVSGIAIFLLELFNYTGREEYFDVAREAIRWSVANPSFNEPEVESAFLGPLSPLIASIRAGEVSGNWSEFEYCTAKIREIQPFNTRSPGASLDLLAGTAGFLLALLRIHSIAKDDSLLVQIAQRVSTLVKGLDISEQGFSIGGSAHSIKPLCGMSHGASGVALCFLELGHYFHNPDFFWVAEQLFAYEDSFFDQQKVNWPDFRMNSYSFEGQREMVKEYESGNGLRLLKAAEMSAWCHGRVGIGHARLRAFSQLGTLRYRIQTEQSIRAGIEQLHHLPPDSVSFTLCHGAGGLIDLMVEASAVLQVPDLLADAMRLGAVCIESGNRHNGYLPGARILGQDTSLFNGNAGIGHLCIRLLSRSTIPSVLCSPTLTPVSRTNDRVANYPILGINKSEILTQCAHKYFPKTTSYAFANGEDIKVAHERAGRMSESTDRMSQLIDSVRGAILTGSLARDPELACLFSVDVAKVAFDSSVQSRGLILIEDLYIQGQASQLAELITSKDYHLFLNPRISCLRLKELRPEWTVIPTTHPQLAHLGCLLLKPAADTTLEIGIDERCQQVLSCFAHGSSISAARIACVQSPWFRGYSTSDIESFVVLQVNDAVRNGILIDQKSFDLISSFMEYAEH